MHKLLDFSVDYLKSLQISAEPGVSQIDQVVNFIQKNIHQNVTRTEIAHQVYMNPEYLSRLFKKVKGISLSDYIVQEKLKIAISLLEGTNLPVSVIATNIGYTNFSYFTQVFKKSTEFLRVNTVKRKNNDKNSTAERKVFPNKC